MNAADFQDFHIMRLRTLATLRGATPAEIQRNVMALEGLDYADERAAVSSGKGREGSADFYAAMR